MGAVVPPVLRDALLATAGGRRPLRPARAEGSGKATPTNCLPNPSRAGPVHPRVFLLESGGRVRKVWVMAAMTLGSALACGGLGASIGADTLARVRWMLESVEDSPEKDQVIQWTEEGYVQAATEKLGVGDVSRFASTVEDAIEDGVIHADELATLREAAARFDTPGADSPKRQALLAEMAAYVAKRNKKGAAPTPAPPDIDTWTLADLEGHASVLGKPSCSASTEIEGMLTCQVPGGTVVLQDAMDAEAASVLAEAMGATMAVHQQGKTLLMVGVSDHVPLMATLSRWAPAGTTPELTEAWISGVVEADGLTTEGCTPLDIEGQEAYSCMLKGEGVDGILALSRAEGLQEQSPTPAGPAVEAVVGGVKLTLSLTSDAQRKALADVLRGS